MNSIIEQFGKKKSPQMPFVPTKQPDPKHAEAISFVSDLAEQVQRLQADNATLSQQLAVALELGNEFKRLHDIAAAEACHWQAYAVESRTIFQMFNDLARRGHEHGKAAQDRNQRAKPDKMDVEAIGRAITEVFTLEDLHAKGKTFASELVMNLWIEENHLSADQATEVRAGYLSKPKT